MSLNSEVTPGEQTVLLPKNQRDSEKLKATKRLQLFCLVALNVLLQVGNSVTFKMMLNAYRAKSHNYEYFANQFNLMLYVLGAAIIVSIRVRGKGASWLRTQLLSICSFAVMGLLDATAGFLTTIGGANTAGSLQNLINQTIIPVTLAMSAVFLRARVTRCQAGGAFIIVAGAACALLPSILSPPPAPDDDAVGEGGGSTLVGIAVFSASIIPGAFSNVYKEGAFRSASPDVWVLTTSVATLQVLSGIALMPALALPEFGGQPLATLPTALSDGWGCFQGLNLRLGDHCFGAGRLLMGYSSINFIFNWLQLLLTKYGSAALLVTSAAIALPITNFAFSCPRLMGADVEPFTIADGVALIAVLGGFLVYALGDGVLDGGADEGGADASGKRVISIQFAAGSMMYTRPRANSDPEVGTPAWWAPSRLEISGAASPVPPDTPGAVGRAVRMAGQGARVKQSPSISRQSPRFAQRSSSATAKPRGAAALPINITPSVLQPPVHEPSVASSA